MDDPAGTNPTADAGAGIEYLVERFNRNIDAYRAGKYNETLVRREFIDPMFAALGWDIDNRAGYAEAYKDVIHEDAIKMGMCAAPWSAAARRRFHLSRSDGFAVRRRQLPFNPELVEGPRRQLSIPHTTPFDPTDKSRHDRMVELVERMLGLHKSLAAAKTDHDKTLLQRQITATDNQIDQLVYELYGLSNDEIGIVEGAGSPDGVEQ